MADDPKSGGITRKTFLAGALAAATASGALAQGPRRSVSKRGRTKRPLAITMWDFSWLERRWDGAGYEDWDQALDELVERGYDAVRIDAYPHLVSNGPREFWTLKPQWNTQDWGSPDVNRVQVLPALTQFIAKCKARGVRVGLSTWYRQDADDTRMKITSPEVMAAYWVRTLREIEAAGLLDAIVWVDLCNEWPLHLWAPFFPGKTPSGLWSKPDSLAYMKTAIELVRKDFPQLPLLFSFFNDEVEDYAKHDVSHFDLLEHHIWMAQANGGEFYKLVDYNYERFDLKGYNNMSLKAEATYRARPDYWKRLLVEKIDRTARAAAAARRPLATTECWGPVDYKDWPLLKWDWVKELCALGTRHAAGTGQWVAIATSNFCGPQFKGMWRDIPYHRTLTRVIKNAPINPQLHGGRMWERL